MSTATLKDMSLEELDVRLAELRAGLSELSEGERSDENGAQISALLRDVSIADAHYTLARHQTAREEMKAAAERAAEEAQQYGPRGANGDHSGNRVLTLGEQIMGNDRVKAFIEGGVRMVDGREDARLMFTLDDVANLRTGSRAVNEWGNSGPGNAATGSINSLLPVGQPIAPIPRQARLAIRDLIPSQPTTLSLIPYVRELTPTSNEFGASAVAEAGTKPDVSLNFTGKTTAPTVIAASISPSKQLWEDAPLVVAYINQRLPYLLRFKEDWEFINGSGTWPDVNGIKNDPNVQTQNAVSGQFAQTIGKAIADVENVDATATGCVLNPTDAWNMFTLRASSGAGTFDAGNPFSMDPVDALTVWGLPTVRSRAYAAGTAIVGDFAHGAMILDRDGINIQIYPQHSTYALSNQILVLAEERVALALWRPDAFVITTLA